MKLNLQNTFKKTFAALLLLLSFSMAHAQISIPTTATPETFTIGTSANASLPANWKMSPAGATAPTYAASGNLSATNFAFNTGAPTTGGRYNWGNSTTTTDRAIGFMTSGGYDSPNSIMAFYRNTSGSTMSDISISFDIERYRINSAAANVKFYTSTNGSTWTERTTGATGAFATGASSYTFDGGTVVSKTVTLTGINLVTTGNLYLRWAFDTTGGSSQGLGLDNVSVIGTIPPTLNPSITTSVSSLSAFADTNINGSHSASKNFNVEASELSENLVITAPTHFKVSKDDITYAQSISYTPSSGTVASTTVYVRFEPTTIGSHTGNVTAASGSVSKNVAVSGNGFSTAPYFDADALAAFGSVCDNTTSVARSFNLYGFNLTASVAVGPFTGYAFSTTAGEGYTESLTLFPTGGELAQQVFVKFTPTAVESYSGNIPVTGGGVAATFNVAVSGAGINTPATVATGSAGTLSSTGAVLSGSVTVGCSAIIGYGIEYSTVNNFSNGSGTTVAGSNLASGSFSVPVTGLAPNTTYYFKAYATDATGTIRGTQSSFLTSGLEVPTGLTGTNVHPTSFAANWGSVTGATGYRLDVSTSANFGNSGQTLLQQGFESATFPPTGWANTGWTRSTDLGDINSGNGAAIAGASSGTLTTVAIAHPTSLSFYLGRSSNANAKILTVEVSTTSQTAGFTTVMTYNHSNVPVSSYNQYTVDLSAYASNAIVYIRFVKSSSTTSPWRFDDVLVTGNVPSFVSPYENFTVTGTSQTVSGLTPNTQYYFRVRAVSTNSTSANSTAANVTTLTAPTFTGISAAPACLGFPTTFNVTGLSANMTTILAYNINGASSAVSIAADGVGNGSFALTLSAGNNGQTLTVTSVSRNDSPAVADAVAVTTGNTVALAANAAITYYADADEDGFGDAAVSQASCTGAPVGYVANNSDCNPTAKTYLDFDGDTYGSMTLAPCGVLNNTDCNDNAAAIHTTYPFYVDNDLDGFGTGTATFLLCAAEDEAPTGYSVNNTDCDDDNNEVNPGHGEVLYNGIDDNCDDNLDEGFELITQLQTSQRGVTLPSIYTSIGANIVSGVSGYRFTVKKTNSSDAAQEIVRSVHWFALNMLTTYEYATTYDITVEVRVGGTWVGYTGDTYSISSPAILSPGNSSAVTQCGTTLPNIYSSIGIKPLTGVTGYKFLVTNVTVPGSPSVPLDRGSSAWFSLTMLPSYAYGTKYAVQVAVKTTGGYGAYGPECLIDTPAVSGLVNCGGQQAATKNTPVATPLLSRVTQYQFEITYLEGSSQIPEVSTLNSNTAYFKFSQVANYVPNGLYGVRVRVNTGAWSPFSEPCEVQAPAATRSMGDTVLEGDFDAIASPNPFSGSFAINLITGSQESVSYKVYDMTGRLLETRTSVASELGSVAIGEQFPAGIYNVIVSQGSEVKTLRVIKR